MALLAPKLSDKRAKALTDYIAEIRSALYLLHWEVRLLDEYPDHDDALVQLNPSEQRYIASLAFSTDFWSLSKEHSRNAIVHEMLHLHLVKVTNPIWLGQWRQQVGQALYEHMWGETKREIEYSVDALTVAFQDHLPLPPEWPE